MIDPITLSTVKILYASCRPQVSSEGGPSDKKRYPRPEHEPHLVLKQGDLDFVVEQFFTRLQQKLIEMGSVGEPLIVGGQANSSRRRGVCLSWPSFCEFRPESLEDQES